MAGGTLAARVAVVAARGSLTAGAVTAERGGAADARWEAAVGRQELAAAAAATGRVRCESRRGRKRMCRTCAFRSESSSAWMVAPAAAIS